MWAYIAVDNGGPSWRWGSIISRGPLWTVGRGWRHGKWQVQQGLGAWYLTLILICISPSKCPFAPPPPRWSLLGLSRAWEGKGKGKQRKLDDGGGCGYGH